MGLVTGITKRVEVPHDPGAHITFRMLSWLRLKEARDVRLDAIVKQAAAFASLKNLVTASEPSTPDMLTGYDQLTLLRHGIVSWSYGEEVTPEDLDERTAEWAAREILDLSVVTEQASKAPASPSTGTSAGEAERPKNG